MNIIEIITKKKNGYALTDEEIDYAFQNYLNEKIPDYQMSSLLMAICINGMNYDETTHLTDLFLRSGDTLDLSSIDAPKVDKHSTGGIGDKTTMIIGPIVASLGVVVPKMSGRGLGITGGTIDKLESIPGFRTNLKEDEFLSLLKKNGFAVTSQTSNLVPMDRKIYALRDVTGTTESLPLIASSILSKKIAGGADKILIDIKVGEGALVKTMSEAIKLSDIMKKIGEKYKKEVRTLLTPMDTPLGYAIGNRVEVLEAMAVLKGESKSPLTDLCVQLASHMVSMGKNLSYDVARDEVLAALEDGSAYQKFVDFVHDQGGDLDQVVLNSNKVDILAPCDGEIDSISALKMGELAISLGAGRLQKEDEIDPGTGIMLHHLVGEKVQKGDVLFTMYGKEEALLPFVDPNEYYTFK